MVCNLLCYNLNIHAWKLSNMPVIFNRILQTHTLEQISPASNLNFVADIVQTTSTDGNSKINVSVSWGYVRPWRLVKKTDVVFWCDYQTTLYVVQWVGIHNKTCKIMDKTFTHIQHQNQILIRYNNKLKFHFCCKYFLRKITGYRRAHTLWNFWNFLYS